jgi:hypothetical protein
MKKGSGHIVTKDLRKSHSILFRKEEKAKAKGKKNAHKKFRSIRKNGGLRISVMALKFLTSKYFLQI